MEREVVSHIFNYEWVLIRKSMIVSITEAVDGTTLVNLSVKEYKEMQSFYHAAESFETLRAQLM
ncbi:MAG: hypothetical protein EOP49_32470 [Sphingobacteriales bacterium]|nr:MAG: hypothetical protein EOP49_32470 [Sphingobacteriales bacterium]